MSPDPRTERDGICRVTFIGATGIEWMCIRQVHAKFYTRRNGRMVPDTRPDADRHYYVNRWPQRPIVLEEP